MDLSAIKGTVLAQVRSGTWKGNEANTCTIQSQ